MDALVVLLFVVVFANFIVLNRKEFEMSGGVEEKEIDSTEDSPSEVTPAPSPPGDENTGPSCFATGCWVLAVALICFGLFMALMVHQFLDGLGQFFGGVKDFSDAVDHRLHEGH